ncbi:hypothetical protein BpHYR1_026793 [Brachionus plicatilis]|uniref:Uncharacterized protein n=1 Tax=Brachionus plicatilis TaxID=10195 RepID=A0A3M7QNZ1_BRAPC|nr:hypothetical protein BpHYR1_026793 [Brachionus plicatilis]
MIKITSLKNKYPKVTISITIFRKNTLMLIVESTRIPDFKTPLPLVSKNLQQWSVQSFSSNSRSSINAEGGLSLQEVAHITHFYIFLNN